MKSKLESDIVAGHAGVLTAIQS